MIEGFADLSEHRMPVCTGFLQPLPQRKPRCSFCFVSEEIVRKCLFPQVPVRGWQVWWLPGPGVRIGSVWQFFSIPCFFPDFVPFCRADVGQSHCLQEAPALIQSSKLVGGVVLCGFNQFQHDVLVPVPPQRFSHLLPCKCQQGSLPSGSTCID